MNLQTTAELLAYKINFESSTGSETPLSEFLDNEIDDSESFGEDADSIIDKENLELEGFISGVKTVISKIVEGLLWLIEKVSAAVNSILKFFSVTRIRINRLIDRLSDLKNTKSNFSVDVDGWEGLAEEGNGDAINEKLKQSYQAMLMINNNWPRESDIIYKNVKELLGYGREIKQVDHIVTTVREATSALSLDGRYAKEIKTLEGTVATNKKQKYKWTSHKLLLQTVGNLSAFNEQMEKFGSFLRENTRKAFVLKNALKRFIDTYGKLEENTDFNNSVKDALSMYTVTIRANFKLLSRYGATYIGKCLTHLVAVEKEVLKYNP